MADEELTDFLKSSLTIIADQSKKKGNNKVSTFFFSRSCDSHPSLAEHKMIANELTSYLKNLMHW